MRRLFTKLALASVAIFALTISPAAAQIFVNCDEGESIQDALDAQDWAPRADVDFVGTCNEQVTLRNNRTAITGFEDATINGQIRMFGPLNATLRNMTITGPGQGITIASGRVRVFDVDLVENYGYGISASGGATVRLSRGSVMNNGGPHGIMLEQSNLNLNETQLSGHPDLGIAAVHNSSVIVYGGLISENRRGIYANLGSSVEVSDSQITYNVIDGIHLSNSTARVTNTVIEHNNGQGIDVNDGSFATVFGGSINDNAETGLYVVNHSFVRVVGTVIRDNVEYGIQLLNDSGAHISEAAHIPENLSGWAVFCNGKEAGLEVGESAVVGRIKCPDPKF